MYARSFTGPGSSKKYKPFKSKTMAGGKMNARQKMINMMYLVLTAILALNVSKEVLDAFVVINMGLLQQKASLESKNTAMLNQFSTQLVVDSNNSRLKFLNEEAINVTHLSDELSDEIEKMKVDLVVKVDKVDESKAKDVIQNPMKVDKKDDYDGPTRYFGTDNPPGQNGKANQLKLKLNDFRNKCLSIVDKVLVNSPNGNKMDLKKDIEKKLDLLLTKDPTSKEYPTWEMQYFYHLPLSAALTELTKWQNFVKGAELDMLSFLWEEIARNAYKFDAIKVAVIPKSSFVTSGSNFEADVFLAAYSTGGSNLPTITYGSGVDTSTMNVQGGITLSRDKFTNGVGKVSFPVTGVGEKTFAGTLQMKDPSGNTKTLPFSTTYNVAPPSASIAPTNLNVVYYGVDNPFSISVPGVAPNQIQVTASGATVSGSAGNYTINPTNTTGNITVNVSARMSDGTTMRMGTQQFRIKRVPNPEIMISSKPTGSSVSKNQFAGSPIIPDMSGFLFPVYAQVISVKGSIKVSGGDLRSFEFTGNQFPANIQKMIRESPFGTKIFLDDIKVKVPGGNRTMSASYTLI
jgi:gliding motility-associated protein GldM